MNVEERWGSCYQARVFSPKERTQREDIKGERAREIGFQPNEAITQWRHCTEVKTDNSVSMSSSVFYRFHSLSYVTVVFSIRLVVNRRKRLRLGHNGDCRQSDSPVKLITWSAVLHSLFRSFKTATCYTFVTAALQQHKDFVFSLQVRWCCWPRRIISAQSPRRQSHRDTWHVNIILSRMVHFCDHLIAYHVWLLFLTTRTANNIHLMCLVLFLNEW